MIKKYILIITFIPLFVITTFPADNLSNVDMQYGNLQVSKMLSDRPRMSEVKSDNGKIRKLTEKDEIWAWAAQAFGQKINGEPVEWDNSDLDKPPQYQSDHTIPNAGQKGLIRVRETFKDWLGQTRQATFDELWSACVFELLNIQNAEGFMDNYHKAVAGQLTKEEWVYLNTKLEYDALVKLKEFYKTVWIPWSEKNGHRDQEYAWERNTPDSYEEWINVYKQSKSNTYQFWQDYFDEKMVPYLKKTGKL
jgi:hypothetical protein